MYAVTWYDDTKAASLFKKHGAFSQNHLRKRVGSSQNKPVGGMAPKQKTSYFESIDGSPGMDSPLLAAFSWKKWRMAEWLLKNGADPDAADQRGATALFHAVRKKYDADHIQLLLKYGADPDRATNDGRTPRSLAAKYRDKTIFDLIE
jgi:hypothetical protein